MAEGKREPNLSTPNGESKLVTVTILGNQIRLRSEKDSFYIQKLTEEVEKRIKACMDESGVTSSWKAVVLTCFTLLDEMEKEKRNHIIEDTLLNERIEKLITKIPSL